MKQSRLFLIITAVVIVGVILFLSTRNRNISEFGLEIPNDKLFADAPPVSQCESFDVVFTYDDSAKPIRTGDKRERRIIWNLYVTPRAGLEARDFYFTLVLDDWIVGNMQYAMPHLGLDKDMAMDIPSETTGFHSTLDKFIAGAVTGSPEYREHINAPVNIMLVFDGRREYYKVTPEFRAHESATD